MLFDIYHYINIYQPLFYNYNDNKDFLIENINLIDYNKAISELKQLPNVDIQINHVLQITSIFYLKDVLQFSEEHGFHLNIQKPVLVFHLEYYVLLMVKVQQYIQLLERVEMQLQRFVKLTIPHYIIKSLHKATNKCIDLHIIV